MDNAKKIAAFLEEAFNPATSALRLELVPSGLMTTGNNLVQVFDDFTYINTARWTAVNDGSTGSLALEASAATGGWIRIPTAAAANDYHFLQSASKPFKFAADKPLYFEARIRLTEANTDDAIWAIGLSSISTSGFMQNGTAGPPADYDGAVFFKVLNGTVMQFETSAATAQVTDTDVGVFTSGSTYTLAIAFDPGNGTTGTVKAYVNGNLVATNSIALASRADMFVILGAKAGDGNNAETLLVDYVRCQQLR